MQYNNKIGKFPYKVLLYVRISQKGYIIPEDFLSYFKYFCMANLDGISFRNTLVQGSNNKIL